MSIVAKIKNDKLLIEIDLEKKPKDSQSGKSTVIATTHGNVETEAEYKGKRVKVGLSAYVKND